MALNFGQNLFGKSGLFKDSPNDGQVRKSRGSRQVSEDDTDTNTTTNDVFKGDWSGATTYIIGDLAENNGALYICTATSTNNEPPNVSYWTLMSSDTNTTYTAGTGVGLVGTQFSSDDGNINHNSLNNFDVDKHKAWANSIAENVHADNYTDTGDTTYTAGTGVDLTGTTFSSDDTNIDHDNLNHFDAAKHKAWAASIADNIHADNYTDTGDTTYTAGTGVNLAGTEFSSDDGNIDHDQLANHIAKKHRAWEDSIAENVNAANYTDTQPTKEFWVPSSGTSQNQVGDIWSYQCYAGSEFGGATFRVPYDFNSITSAELIIISDTTDGTANLDIYANYGAVGEAYNTHDEDDTGSTYNLTANEFKAIDVSGILSSLAANDHVGIYMDEADIDKRVHVIGFHLRYT